MCESSTLTPQRCILDMFTSKQTLGRTDVTTQAQAHGGYKAWQSLDIERLT